MSFIIFRDIRKEHPFGVSSPTDTDYVRIANSVLDMLRYVSFCAQCTDEEMKRMTIRLSIYFEVIVSEIGLWHSLVQKHLPLFSKPLPL